LSKLYIKSSLYLTDNTLRVHYKDHAVNAAYGFFLSWLKSRSGPRLSQFLGFEITLRRTTLGRTPPDE
jgi:hypothetical protein